MLDPRTSQKLPFVLARGILASSSARRTWMGVLLVASALLLFLGAGPLSGWIEDSLLRFLVFWMVTLLLVCATFGVALLEVLRGLERHRREIARLREEMGLDEDE